MLCVNTVVHTYGRDWSFSPSDANRPDGNHAPVMMSLLGSLIRKQHRISLCWIVVLTTVSRAPLKLLSLSGFLWGVFTCSSLCAGFWFHGTESGELTLVRFLGATAIETGPYYAQSFLNSSMFVTFIQCKYKLCTHWEPSIWVLPVYRSHDKTAFFSEGFESLNFTLHLLVIHFDKLYFGTVTFGLSCTSHNFC